jgi:hypothetical protein
MLASTFFEIKFYRHLSLPFSLRCGKKGFENQMFYQRLKRAPVSYCCVDTLYSATRHLPAIG